MKKIALLVAVLSVVGTPWIGIAAEEKTAEARTLKGEFEWNQRGSKGDLDAVFTATGEGAWDVSFHFEFRGSPHTYTGTAEGSLSEGALKGKVFNEGGKRTFTFDGEFKDGRFKGTHAEVEGSREVSTGTLELGE